MLLEEKYNLADFWVIGINYRKTDAVLRGRYAISQEQYEHILNAAPTYGVKELFVLSTCNRTEIYGIARHAVHLEQLICDFTEGDKTAFQQQCYRKQGHDALTHIFHVAAGLDSQILGDYEIVGQMKQAVNFAKSKDRLGAFLERLFHTTLQSSRAIRSETDLSSGTVSVAFAAVQFIKNTYKHDLADTKILIIGSGKIGQNTCKNLVTHARREHITLMNRTEEKARMLAEILQCNTAAFDDMDAEIQRADVVIVATNAPQPIVDKTHLRAGDRKILIDLSIPNNVHPNVQEYHDIVLANVDDLSKINDETLRMRLAEVPKAQALINLYIHEFAEWYLMRQNVPVIKAVKEKLIELNSLLSEVRKCDDHTAVQRTLNTMAVKMRREDRKPGCNYIEALNGYLSEAIN